MMKVIGLTGGIGSGKTTVSQILKEQGLPVLDGDVIAREIVEPGQPAYYEIIEGLGETVLQPGGELDRKKIGAIVFSDPQKLSLLNQITHREILRVIRDRLDELRKKGVLLVFLDAALLFDAGFDRLTDEVWVVDVPESLQIERIRKRDHLSEEEIRKRIESQMERTLRREKGHYILDNSKGREELKDQVLQGLKRYESNN